MTITLLPKKGFGKGLETKLWLYSPTRTEPGVITPFLLLEGWGCLHKRIDNWFPHVQSEAQRCMVRNVVIIGPKNPEAEEYLMKLMEEARLAWAWIGNNKLTFQPKQSRQVLGIETRELINAFDQALFFEETFELRKVREEAHKKVLAQIKKEERHLKEHPIICETYDLARSYFLGKRGNELFKEGPYGTKVPTVACLTEDLEHGILVNPRAPIAFSVETRLTLQDLEAGKYWPPYEDVHIKHEDSSELWRFWIRKLPPEAAKHPRPDPHDPNPTFTPLWKRAREI